MGPDNIHPLVLKALSTTMAVPLTLLFNKSLESGHIPIEWKDARVTPPFKKGSKSDAGNYRQLVSRPWCVNYLRKLFENTLLTIYY